MTSTADARLPAGSFADIVPTYADTRPVPTIYLFRDQTITLPRGHVVVVYGPGGVGKGMLAVDFAARNSRGENAAGEPGMTIMVTPEDDINEIVAWRLKAAEADTRRIIDKTTLPAGGPFRLGVSGRGAAERRSTAMRHAMSLAELKDTIIELQEFDDRQRKAGVTDPELMANPTLVIIEPLLACVGGNLLATDDGARSVLAPLQQLAAETGVCVLITHHSTKEGREVAGSRAMLNAPRLVYEITRKEGEQLALITLRKANILGMAGSSRYAIVGEEHDAHVAWAAADGTPLGGADDADAGLPAWRAQAMRGPLSAIGGAQFGLLTPFAQLAAAEQAEHLMVMHGMPVDQAQALAGMPAVSAPLHRVRHDLTAIVSHRHAPDPVLHALPAGATISAPAERDDTTGEPSPPTVQAREVPPRGTLPLRGAKGDESRSAPRGAGAASSRGTRPLSPSGRQAQRMPTGCKHPWRTRGLCGNCPRRGR